MAGTRIDMLDLRKLLTLKEKGYSNRQAADALGVNRNTVNSYIKAFKGKPFDNLLKLNNSELCSLFPERSEINMQRYEELSTSFPYFLKELRKPGCTLDTLWKEYRSSNQNGYGYTQFAQHFKDFRQAQNGSGKLTHIAGEKLYIDFAGKKLHYVDKSTGELIPVEVLVCILPCSQYTFIMALKSQRMEDVITGLTSCLEFMGGVPTVIISDNLKAVVKKSHKYQPEINKSIRQLGLHYGCEIFATRPYKPQDKALVEGAVKLVYQRMYYPLSKHTFFSLEQINSALRGYLVRYNEYCFAQRTTSRFKEYLELERPHLTCLPQTPFRIKTYKRAKVQKMGFIHISEDKNYYSVPHRFVGKHVQIEYCSDHVEVFYHSDRIAFHQRSYRNGSYNAKEEHLSSRHKIYNEWSPTYFQKRAKSVGASTYFYITQLIESKAYPEAAYKQCQGILALQKTYSAQRLELACKRAADAPKKSYHTIALILEKGLEGETMLPSQKSHIPQHSNVRGGNHYQ